MGSRGHLRLDCYHVKKRRGGKADFSNAGGAGVEQRTRWRRRTGGSLEEQGRSTQLFPGFTRPAFLSQVRAISSSFSHLIGSAYN